MIINNIYIGWNYIVRDPMYAQKATTLILVFHTTFDDGIMSFLAAWVTKKHSPMMECEPMDSKGLGRLGIYTQVRPQVLLFLFICYPKRNSTFFFFHFFHPFSFFFFDKKKGQELRFHIMATRNPCYRLVKFSIILFIYYIFFPMMALS